MSATKEFKISELPPFVSDTLRRGSAQGITLSDILEPLRAAYFSKENKAISNSKVRDYEKSPAYFKRRYIDGTEVFTPTPSMQLGSMVDCLFEGASLESRFTADKKDESGLEIVQPAQYAKAMEIFGAIEQTAAYQWYEKHPSLAQLPLSSVLLYDGKDEVEVPFCGLLDRLTLDRKMNTLYIDDLKVVSPAKLQSYGAWSRNAWSMNYYRQMAVYRELVRDNFPQSLHIECRWLVAGSTYEGGYPIKMFKACGHCMDLAWESFGRLAGLIWTDEKFDERPVTWDDARTICVQQGEIDDVDEGVDEQT